MDNIILQICVLFTVLDDLATMKKVDPKNMLSLIESLPEQLMECKVLAENLGTLKKPKSIVVAGMGGSGIVGDLLRDWLSGRIEVPIVTNKNLVLPSFLDDDTMLIAVSYSGNTRETLLALKEGLSKTANVLCIASGGSLLDLCSERGLDHVKVPPGYPPRCALGYLFGSAANALKKAGIFDGEGELEEAASHLKELRAALTTEKETARNQAKKLALEIQGHTPIVYAYEGFHSCAKRWQTCLNENAKVLSWCGSLPEMTHNEVVGLEGDEKVDGFALVFLRDRDEPEYVRQKFEFVKGRTKCKVLEVWAEGEGRLSRMLHLMYTGDLVSYYLAILRGVDPMPVNIIEEMKNELREDGQ